MTNREAAIKFYTDKLNNRFDNLNNLLDDEATEQSQKLTRIYVESLVLYEQVLDKLNFPYSSSRSYL